MKKLIIFLFSLPFNVLNYVIKFVFTVISILCVLMVSFSGLATILCAYILEKNGYNTDSSGLDEISDAVGTIDIVLTKYFWKWHKYTIKKQ